MEKPIAPNTGFSNNFIKGLTPPAKDRYYVFEGRDGLGIRVTVSGTKTFVKSYRFNDKKKLMTIGRYPAITLSEAREAVLEAKNLLVRGIDPALIVKIKKNKKLVEAELTFGDLADKYLDSKTEIAKSTVDTYRDCLYNYIFPSKKPLRKDGKEYSGFDYADWTNYPAADVTKEDIRSILKVIVDNGIGRRANLTLTVIKQVFKFGITELDLEKDPTAGVIDPAKKSRGSRFLAENEIAKFWNGLLKIRSHKTVLMLRLILLLGRRETEVCGAQWKEFDLDKGEWFIPTERNQNGTIVSSGLKVHNSNKHLVDGLMVPLPNFAVEMLRKYKEEKFKTPLLHVFPSEYEIRAPQDYKSLSRALSRNHEIMGLETPVKPSDLRRTAKTHLARLEVPQHIRDKITGHSVGSRIEQTYNRYDDLPAKRAALEKWSSEIQRLVASASINTK